MHRNKELYSFLLGVAAQLTEEWYATLNKNDKAGVYSSAGALALGVANHIHMLENSTYSVISPEGAASILWKTPALAKQAAEAMKITAPDLKQMGIVDEIIQETTGGAHRDSKQQAIYLKEALERSIDTLCKLSEDELVDDRYNKFKAIGELTE